MGVIHRKFSKSQQRIWRLTHCVAADDAAGSQLASSMTTGVIPHYSPQRRKRASLAQAEFLGSIAGIPYNMRALAVQFLTTLCLKQTAKHSSEC